MLHANLASNQIPPLAQGHCDVSASDGEYIKHVHGGLAPLRACACAVWVARLKTSLPLMPSILISCITPPSRRLTTPPHLFGHMTTPSGVTRHRIAVHTANPRGRKCLALESHPKQHPERQPCGLNSTGKWTRRAFPPQGLSREDAPWRMPVSGTTSARPHAPRFGRP